MLAIVCILLVCACVYDYRDRRIPNWVIVLLLLTSCMMKMLSQLESCEPMILVEEDKVLMYIVKLMVYDLIGMFAQMLGVLVLFYAFFKIGALGAGDVKLLAVCAGVIPAKKILLFLFISLLIAALLSLCRLVQEQNIRERFLYLYEYIVGVMRNGAWRLYIENEEERRARGICMSGPILCSILLYLGGVY